MIHIVGNCAGSGSSLLSQIFDRHSAVFSGEETQLFAKKKLYDDWQKNKGRISKNGLSALRSPGWHMYNGVDLLDVKLKIDPRDFEHFSDYAHHLVDEIWIEKTPGNVYCFQDFLQVFPNGKVIFIHRHPLDNIASLCNRGLTPFNAVARYLVANAAGLSVKSERIKRVSYEKLTAKPKETINMLCDFLDLSFENAMLQTNQSKVKMEGWGNFEDGPIASGNSRFEQLTKEGKSAIKFWIDHLIINPKCSLFSNQGPNSIAEISVQFKYALDSLSKIDSDRQSRFKLTKDLWHRTIRNYPTGLGNYPIKLS